MNTAQRVAFVAIAVTVVAVAARLLSGGAVSVARVAFVMGLLAALSLAGIIYGLRTARQTERRRKTKLDIWLNH